MAREEIGHTESEVVALLPTPDANPGPIIDAAREYETELRRLFATDKGNERLRNPHVGLLDVFKIPDGNKGAIPRDCTDGDVDSKYAMPLKDGFRRAKGEQCLVGSVQEFQDNWSLFTENVFDAVSDWDGFVIAGGSVLACLTPLPDSVGQFPTSIRNFYRSQYPVADIDLFLCGLSPEQAEEKISSIYRAMEKRNPFTLLCVRTKYTVSIHSSYPMRPIQIVLRLYSSVAEVLAGFDIDACCVAYDGRTVWSNPRGVTAMVRQCNVFDVTRRSPSYEVRLAKYSRRGFEVHVPSLERERIDPQIFEHSSFELRGLARLLCFEKLAKESYPQFLLQMDGANQRTPEEMSEQGDDDDNSSEVSASFSNYDAGTVGWHIPYGLGWNASTLKTKIYVENFLATRALRERGFDFHHHFAFYGTAEECMESPCPNCPQPTPAQLLALGQCRKEEACVRGRISFIEDNPGQQMLTGSFRPVEAEEWYLPAYHHVCACHPEVHADDAVDARPTDLADNTVDPCPKIRADDAAADLANRLEVTVISD